ncbi:malate synthase-like isoform X2 [Pararge aegeria]|uniref:malate synthase-like isoform X2 n=1 Tax=Pararge aegeria TaxID=116150 RepID=UPI0019D073DD|nr:malate synthase-like isoform X2 [Pararge aegeria]
MSSILLLQSSPPKLEDVQRKLYNKGALEFLVHLHREFDLKIEQLYKNRVQRAVDTKSVCKVDFKISSERLDKSWNVAPLPTRLQYVFINHVRWCFASHKHSTSFIIIFALFIDGKEAIGPLVDFGILMYHNGKKLYEANSGPYFYLSKLEGASEAQLWNEIFVWTQNKLGLPHATIKACVLIENIISTFELEEILFALKDHCMGLNCGIWDYCASIIAKFGDRKEFLLPDRNKYVNMDKKFLNSYMKLVVNTCHERGALATGGMAAAMLKPGSDGADDKSKAIINRVLEAKSKEIEAGVDGFMVYDTRIVPHINELWKKTSGTLNQLHRIFDLNIAPQELLSLPSGGVTMQGLKHNVAVSILFVYHWLAGIGHFFYSGNIEDSATAEISRAQIWQWIRFSPMLEDSQNQYVTAQLVDKVATNFASHAHKNLCRSSAERKRLTAAKYMCLELFLARNPPEFITTYLNDNHKFRTLHNKALLSNL